MEYVIKLENNIEFLATIEAKSIDEAIAIARDIPYNDERVKFISEGSPTIHTAQTLSDFIDGKEGTYIDI